MSTDARGVILSRIAAAMKDRAPESADANAAEWNALSRDYDCSARLREEEKLNLLEDRLRDYDAEVTRVADNEVAGVIAAVIVARDNRPALLPQGFPAHWIPTGTPLTIDEGLSPRELDRFDTVITGATTAIAETGSFVLQNVPGQGRRAATLVPDFHLCVIRVADVVENVPEAFAKLAAVPTLPTTFVSGPSATADIEMTRIKGVHGPRFLHVLLVSDPLRTT